jgi:hypothetical protein
MNFIFLYRICNYYRDNYKLDEAKIREREIESGKYIEDFMGNLLKRR